MAYLIQFCFRFAFGLALAMVVTSPRKVTSGYFRNNCYVLLGFNVLATLVAFSHRETLSLAPPIVGAILSYAAGVAWLYEGALAGRILLGLLAVNDLVGAWLASSWSHTGLAGRWLDWLDAPTGGALVGTATAAMLLGHWYLNSPGMQLQPLFRLIALIAGLTALRMMVSGAGLLFTLESLGFVNLQQGSFLLLRWLFGLLGSLVLAWMAWQTLKIPNTQSATGILYVAVIGTMIGEMMALLCSAAAPYPL